MTINIALLTELSCALVKQHEANSTAVPLRSVLRLIQMPSLQVPFLHKLKGKYFSTIKMDRNIRFQDVIKGVEWDAE